MAAINRKNTRDKELAIYDLAVIGSGLSGLLAAWAGIQSGLRIVHIAPDVVEPDGRTTALLADSITYLDELGLWEDVRPHAFPLKTMRIIDATGRLIRAPQVDFVSSEVGLEAFGYNIENRVLADLLGDRLAKSSDYTREITTLEDADQADSAVELQTADGMKHKALNVIAADGKNSKVRQSLGISERAWQYPQVAMVGNFSHTLPHHDVSTEFHTPTGPTTLVPLGRNRSSLVCVVDPAQADQLIETDLEQLNTILEERMESVLGKITLEAPLKRFPLSAMVANSFGAGRIALVGEAAHVFPPIGAQGLNLGLRDIREAISQLQRATSGSAEGFGGAYDRARKMDVNSRTASVDLLNRSLLSEFLPVQLVRSLGLYSLGAIGPLRRLMMREGVAPGLGGQSFRNRLRDFVGNNPLAR